MSDTLDKLDKFQLFNIGECQHCHKPYSNPHILNCLHTFCLDCIKNMSHGSDPKCCLCKEKFELQSNGLPTHYSNRSFEDLSKVKQFMGRMNIKQICDLCKKNPATEYCRECKMIICDHDAKTHRKATKDEHQLFSLDVFNNHSNIFKLIPENTMNYCKNHTDKLIQFYCYRCNYVLCTECAHAGHMEDPCYANEMNSMFHGRREMVTQRQTEQEVKVDNIAVQKQHHQSQIEDIVKEEENLLNKINNEFDSYINRLKLRKEELNNIVKRVFAQRRKAIEEVITSQDAFMQDSKRLLDMTSFYLTDLPGTHLFPPAVALCNKMDQLERIRPAISADLNQLDFSFSRDSQFIHDPQRIGKLSFRFPLGFESPRYDIELNTKMKLPFEFKINGMAQTLNGSMQILLQDINEKRKHKSNYILRLNQCFQPTHINKWLENITTLDESSSISNFTATREGTTLIVDRNNRQFHTLINGRISSSLSVDTNTNNLADPFNVISRKDEGFVIFNKDVNRVELYNSGSQLETHFEVFPLQKSVAPSTPTTRGSMLSATPEPSFGSGGGFLAFPQKSRTPENQPRSHSHSSSLQIGCNSFGEIYYAYDTKPTIKRFNQKGENLGEKTYTEHKMEGVNRVANSSKSQANAQKPPLERSGTLRKGNRPPSSASKPITLTIPIAKENQAQKPKNMRTLLAIDPFNNVYIYQSGYIYVLDMSLDNVQAKGKLNFEPDYMMVTEMGQIILTTCDDSKIRVY